jgi:hypothetical protein
VPPSLKRAQSNDILVCRLYAPTEYLPLLVFAIGTVDYVIPFGARHLRRILREWISHYNRGWPHRSLGSGIPAVVQTALPACDHATLPFSSSEVIAKAILGGLHHEYRWGKAA